MIEAKDATKIVQSVNTIHDIMFVLKYLHLSKQKAFIKELSGPLITTWLSEGGLRIDGYKRELAFAITLQTLASEFTMSSSQFSDIIYGNKKSLETFDPSILARIIYSSNTSSKHSDQNR